MKKLLVVLVLGMTMFSCSKKEEVPVETCGELGYTITGFNSEIVEGYKLFSIKILDWAGGEFTLGINKERWEAYKLEKELNGVACWGV
tara:strand:- start:183 stop:446 length:264 start_codon:yes stop_codon:yes gene_type:complete